MGVLGWITLLPLFGAGLVMLVPREEESIHRGLGLATSIVTFLVSLLILVDFDSANAGFQLEVNKSWIEPLGIRFHLGIDGISLWLVLLTTFLVPVTLLSPQAIGIRNIRVREFTVAMLVLETGMIGAFLSLDMFVFYVFWELMLIPMYFIIGIWGGERRLYAAIKFVIYTLVGSLLMLVAILYLYVQFKGATGAFSFDYTDLSHLTLPYIPQLLCFGAFKFVGSEIEVQRFKERAVSYIVMQHVQYSAAFWIAHLVEYIFLVRIIEPHQVFAGIIRLSEIASDTGKIDGVAGVLAIRVFVP